MVKDESKCPACTKDSAALIEAGKEKWISCDACRTWYHWRCSGNGEDLDLIDKWFCKTCIEDDPKRVITIKAPARKSHRKRAQRDYANLNSGSEADSSRWLRMLQGKPIKDHNFRRMKGSEVGTEWLEEDENAMTEPVIIESAEGLGMKMPPDSFTVNDVSELLGEETPVEVIDVANQSASPGWTLGKWVDYFNSEPKDREKIYNVISLEISGTPLANQILPPRLVRELDWVENYWPGTRKGKGNPYPKVQLYCLMGVASAWTDWHIDFAGSSVYYHILHGSKTFYFIRPTPSNLAAYERWSGTEIQNHSWLGDLVDEVFKVELTTGNTMIIPTGWIHAVATPSDTLVFGGNFLHSYNVATQLKVRNIEIATQVPKKFRFPMFSKLCWYVAEKYLRDLKAPSGSSFSSRVLSSIVALADFLVSEVRILEQGSDAAKKEVREQIPSERVKDPAVVARELRWRARLAAGYSSDDEVGGKKSVNGLRGMKRKRPPSVDQSDREPVRFKNFVPKNWDRVTEEECIMEEKVLKTNIPEDLSTWMPVNEGDVDAEVKSRRNVVIKIRRTDTGMEHERIERTVEQWIFPSPVDK